MAVKKSDQINEGRGAIREVIDRILPTALDPEQKRSQAQDATGKGMNKQTQNESLKDLNHGVDITD